jgi:hypothetical protein
MGFPSKALIRFWKTFIECLQRVEAKAWIRMNGCIAALCSRDMSFDNSMNQLCALKQIYMGLGCMPKFLQIKLKFG